MFSVHFCLIVDFMILMPLGPQLMRLLGVVPRQFSLLVSAYTFAAGLMGIAASFFIDRLDRKRAMVIFFAGFTLGNLACALSNQYEYLLLARCVTGLFGGVVGSTLFSITSDSVSVEKRGTATGIILSAFALASILGVPLCIFLANRLTWHAPFFFLVLVAFAILLAILVWLEKMDAHLTGASTSLRQSIGEFKALISRKGSVLSLFFMAFLILGHFTIIPFLFPSFVINAGISEARLPAVYLVGGFASLISSVFFGKLADKHGKKRVFSTSLLVSLIPIVWITHAGVSSLGVVILMASTFFVVMGGRMAPAMALMTAMVASRNRGAFLSLVSSIQQLAAALAAYISGLLVTQTADGRLIGFASVGYWAVGFSLIALILSRGLKPVEGDSN